MKHTDVTIDAEGKRLGRVATEAASLLMGKRTPEFERNKLPDLSVRIVNCSKLMIAEKKMREKSYIRHSHRPGGQKEEGLEELTKRRGYGEAMRRAVVGMLPDNKLRAIALKRLHVEE